MAPLEAVGRPWEALQWSSYVFARLGARLGRCWTAQAFHQHTVPRFLYACSSVRCNQVQSVRCNQLRVIERE
jgi:hypothetical protein